MDAALRVVYTQRMMIVCTAAIVRARGMADIFAREVIVEGVARASDICAVWCI